jgi:predicted  nucleic acid-binding Zn-ribbon protein
MIKSIIKLGVLLLIGVIAYNYFLGDEAEKEQAKSIVAGTGKVIGQGVDILKDEYQKFKDGKYDKSLDKIGNLLQQAKEKGGEYVNDIQAWEEKRKSWNDKKEELLRYIEDNPEEDTAEVKEKLKQLEQEGKALEQEGEQLKDKVEE